MSEQFPSNAHPSPGKQPAARPRQTPVVTNVRIRKKPLFSRVGGRTNSIVRDVIMEVIVPQFLDTFADSFHRAVDDAFDRRSPGSYRSSGRPRAGTTNITPAGYVVTDYNSQYQAGATVSGTTGPRVRPFDFTVYTFPDYAAGQEILDRLRHIVHTYSHATVNDLLNLFNQEPDHVGENYGWAGLEPIEAAKVHRVRGGGAYYLAIPDAQPLKK